MVSAKAQVEKEKGNASFKAGDYPSAIGHYSAAIVADGNDHTFPLNRAAAYLKLGKNEDAERDCTTVLTLSALNAKALFRRGQARLGLGKLEDASIDLNQALKREPMNAAIKDELAKVTALLEKKKSKSNAFRPTNAISPSSTSSPHRRRVPIKIVDAFETTAPTERSKATSSSPVEAQSQIASSSPKSTPPAASTASTTHILTPVSTRSLKSEASTAPATPSPAPTLSTVSSVTPSAPNPEPPRTFKDAKQARENGKTSRIGGGIFRTSGENTVFPTKDYPAPVKSDIKHPVVPSETTSDQSPARSVQTLITPAMPAKPPKTLFDFTRAWNGESSTASKWGLILSIPPEAFPALFKISLEPSQLTSILAVFQEVLDASGNDKTRETVRMYMDAFGKVERFGTVILFLNSTEKAVARGVWKALKVGKEDADRVWNGVWR